MKAFEHILPEEWLRAFDKSAQFPGCAAFVTHNQSSSELFRNSARNEHEAWLVCAHCMVILRLAKEKQQRLKIAVVCPTVAQQDLVRHMADRMKTSHAIHVRTVEELRGKSYDVMLVSMTHVLRDDLDMKDIEKLHIVDFEPIGDLWVNGQPLADLVLSDEALKNTLGDRCGVIDATETPQAEMLDDNEAQDTDTCLEHVVKVQTNALFIFCDKRSCLRRLPTEQHRRWGQLAQRCQEVCF